MQSSGHSGSLRSWSISLTLAIDAAEEIEANTIAESVISMLDVPVAADHEFKLMDDGHWSAAVRLAIPTEFSFDPDNAVTRVRYITRNSDFISWRRVSEEADAAVLEWPLPWWDPPAQPEVLGHEQVRGCVVRAILR